MSIVAVPKKERTIVLRFCLSLALAIMPALSQAETLDDVARPYGLAGELLIARGDRTQDPKQVPQFNFTANFTH
jgi:hypothetical protein